MNLRIALFLSAVVLLMSRIDDAFGPLVFMAMVWLGLVMALRLRPSLRSLVHDRRFPRRFEWVAIAVGVGGGLVTVVALALVFTALEATLYRSLDLPGVIDWSFTALWAFASVAPLWRVLIRPRNGEPNGHHDHVATALIWGVPLGLGLFLARVTVLDPLRGSLSAEVWLGVLAAVPSCGLLIIAGFVGTFAAWRGGGGPSKERMVFTAAALVWAALAVTMVLDLVGLSVLSVPRISSASAAAAGYTLVIACAWAITLWRLRRLEFRNTVTALLAGSALLVLTVLSLIAPIAVSGAAEWEQLVVIALFPVVAVSVLVILLVVNPALNWLNGERFSALREPSPSAASLPTGRFRR